jgi:uncharacterized protein
MTCVMQPESPAINFVENSYMFGDLNKEEIENLLHGGIIGRIGCHADDITYVVPVSYAYDGKYVYVHTLEGMKVQMMRKNPNICFEVDHLKDMANWKTVIAWGKFEELKDEPVRTAALKKLHERILPMVSSVTTHLSPDWPFEPNDYKVIQGIVFRIKLTKKTGKFEN